MGKDEPRQLSRASTLCGEESPAPQKENFISIVLGKDYFSDSARINENRRDNTAMIAGCANVGVVRSDDHREQGSAMPDIVSHGSGMERQRQTG